MPEKRARILLGPALTSLGDGQLRFGKDAAVAFDPGGTILGVGSRARIERRFPRAHRTSVGRSQLILPGFVDAHTHVAQYGIAGRHDGELFDWLRKYVFPAEDRFADTTYAKKVSRAFFHDLRRSGTTTAAIWSTVHEEATDVVFEEAARSGLRCIIGKVMMDRHCPGYLRESTRDSLNASERLCRRWNGRAAGRLRYAFTPRFAPTCSSALLSGAGRLAAQLNAHVQTHLSETRAEVKRVRRLFPGSPTYTSVYARAGLVRSKAIFAHAIYLDATETRLLRSVGAGLAHCPSSNLLLGSGFMRVRELLDSGMSVGLGSDVGGGPEVSLLRVMAAAGFVSRAREIATRERDTRKAADPRLSPSELFHLATLGGARAVGLGSVTGSLEKGKRADLVVLDVARLDPLVWAVNELSPEELVSLISYRGEPRAIVSTWVNGREVYSSSGRESDG